MYGHVNISHLVNTMSDTNQNTKYQEKESVKSKVNGQTL